MELVKIVNTKICYKGKILIKINNLNISDKQKIGFIGKNGVGKTTLAKIISNKNNLLTNDIYVEGKVIRNCSIEYVQQILDQVNMSGGEKEKLEIRAKILSLKNKKYPLLILDEPTSNLDFSQQKWLINTINNFNGSCLIISHDQNFLNSICNTIWYVENKNIKAFKGKYGEFEELEKKKEKRKNARYTTENKRIKKLKEALNYKVNDGHSFKHKKPSISWSDWKGQKSNKEKSEKSIFKKKVRLENKIKDIDKNMVKPYVHKAITFKNVINGPNFKNGSTLLRIEPQIISIQKVELFTIKQPLIVTNNQKISLAGQNKTGKSTFVKSIFDKTAKGYFSSSLKMGYFNQDISLIKNQSNDTVITSLMQSTMFDNRETMQLLGDLSLINNRNSQIKNISGGQLVCFQLAKILTSKHNFLLLDEPTNYLDISSINSLARFINEYPFAIIVISHDKTFIDQLNVTSWIIRQKVLTSTTEKNFKKVYESHNENKNNQLRLLKYKLDEMMMNENASIREITILQKKIHEIEETNK